MKKKIQSAILSSFAFLVLAAFYPGFSFENNEVIILTTIVFVFLHVFVRPILKILSLPLNFLTFGLFSLFINVIILYLLSWLVPNFTLVGFDFAGVQILGLEISSFHLSPFFSTLVASVLLGFLSGVFFWIIA
jgi:putative membrane protein